MELQSHNVTQQPVCPACGNTSTHFLLRSLEHHYFNSAKRLCWEYGLQECSSCGLAWVEPRPTLELARSFYTSSYYPSRKSEAKTLKWSIIAREAAYPKRFPVLSSVAQILTGREVTYTLGLPLQLPRDSAMLELGYGSGSWLLSMFESGFRDLWGYDIDSNPVNADLLKSQGIKVSSGDFLQNSYPHDHFSCVRLEHVFEHLPNPGPVLKRCHELLRPDGLLVLTFPNRNSFSFRFGLHNCPMFQTPAHLFHHTRTSALRLLYDAGFREVGIKAKPVVEVFLRSIGSRYKWLSKIATSRVLTVALAPLYRGVSLLCRQGEFLSVWARK